MRWFWRALPRLPRSTRVNVNWKRRGHFYAPDSRRLYPRTQSFCDFLTHSCWLLNKSGKQYLIAFHLHFQQQFAILATELTRTSFPRHLFYTLLYLWRRCGWRERPMVFVVSACLIQAKVQLIALRGGPLVPDPLSDGGWRRAHALTAAYRSQAADRDIIVAHSGVTTQEEEEEEWHYTQRIDTHCCLWVIVGHAHRRMPGWECFKGTSCAFHFHIYFTRCVVIFLSYTPRLDLKWYWLPTAAVGSLSHLLSRIDRSTLRKLLLRWFCQTKSASLYGTLFGALPHCSIWSSSKRLSLKITATWRIVPDLNFKSNQREN